MWCCTGSSKQAEGGDDSTILLYMNDPQANAPFHYPTNYISTCRYNIITFIPLNLFEQFRRVSNFYFLINAIIGLIPGISSISPYSAVIPLVFVIGVAMIKDGYEDYMRYKSDKRANSSPCNVFRSGEFVQIQSKDLVVGDVIQMKMGDTFNADILLLASTAPEGAAYIETSNLDGETNIKNRKAVEATLGLSDPKEIISTRLSVRCDRPSPALLSWNGVVTVKDREYAVGLDQFLYRTATLRNTETAWGVVLYAGSQTKMFLNLQKKVGKVSALTRKLNYLIVAVLIIQQVFLACISGYAVWFNKSHPDHWYLAPFIASQGAGIQLFCLRYLSYFLLISYLIPISLFVTLELCKVAQAQLMAWDQHMMEFMDGKWVACVANTSDLNEELAQVSYVFTDKTGTLTENRMKFHQGDILGHTVGSNVDLVSSYPPSEETRRYFRLLALCNTIQPFPSKEDPQVLVYEGQSPDEVALVQTAASYGYRLLERTSKTIVIEDHGERMVYTILATLEFTADRKMMSMILREPQTNKIYLFTKGADTNVMARLSQTDPTNVAHVGQTNKTLNEMASLGLRTLVLGQRPMLEPEFNAWLDRFEAAGRAMTNRTHAVDAVCLEAERELVLVGVTAIEDKLQDQVPETLQFFLDAGVVVWMLTGDKRETALTIGATSKLVDPQTDFVQHIDVGKLPKEKHAETIEAQLKLAQKACQRGVQRVAIVIDGITLTSVQANCPELFVEVSQGLNSAICCRLTPLQKANIVAMFQKATGKVALAVGDGANDVSMIQEGRVGVGIVGLEGAQAARAADYAVPRFKHLRRLCAVHGRYSLYRNATCIYMSFYKNILLALLQVYYAFYTGGSSQSLMDGWALSFFNFAFLSWPPLLVGFFEKDIDEQRAFNDPLLYRPLSRGKYFNSHNIAKWFTEAVIQSVLVFFIFFTFVRSSSDLGVIGISQVTTVITISLLKIFVHIRYLTILQFAGIVGSFFLYVLFLIVYSAIPNFLGKSSFYYMGYVIHTKPSYWINVLSLAAVIVVFDVAFIGVYRSMRLGKKQHSHTAATDASPLAAELDPYQKKVLNHSH